MKDIEKNQEKTDEFNDDNDKVMEASLDNSNGEVFSPKEDSNEDVVTLDTAALLDKINSLNNTLLLADDKYKRLHADFENQKKRMASQRVSAFMTLQEEFVKTLLPLVDNFSRAISAMDVSLTKTIDHEGLNLLYRDLLDILNKANTKIVDIKVGDEFNPDLHEAISMISVGDHISMKNKVVQVVEPGYMMNEKIIRFAKVIIGN